MSGATVPYHMRQNKAIDRHIFIDFLTRVNSRLHISDYTYISFGGPTLEDFKIIHRYFANETMISLESESWVIDRQRFNAPVNCINFVNQTSGDFIDAYDGEGNAIIWLDYARPRELRSQIQEFQTLLPKLRHYDIVKITLNANPSALYKGADGEPVDQIFATRFAVLNERVGEFIPQHFTAESMNKRGLADILCKVLENAANTAMRSLVTYTFLPIMILKYSDSAHQMLTATGIILKRVEVDSFIDSTGLSGWNLCTPEWGSPIHINVPALTAIERLTIDQFLPSADAERIQHELNFQFDEDEEDSVEMLRNYKLFYRHYPSYHKVTF